VSAPLLSLGALAALCAAFAVVYAAARWIDNYGIVDIAWSYAFSALAAAYALFGSGWPVRRALVAAMVLVWSLRLGTHLLVRIARKHPVEDGRYAQLRRDWARGFALRMGGFFQLQALSIVLLGIPFLAACSNPDPSLGTLEWAGAALWLLAVSGEALADAQLSMFKRGSGNAGKVCDAGLWRYSRHPNYFFEWLIWVSYFVFGCASPWGWLGILSPACILYLLLRVTGIPMTEEQSIRSKGDAYRRYQQRTSAFVPMPRHRPRECSTPS
jgi:steroid 5-alpha reductase family enzyme